MKTEKLNASKLNIALRYRVPFLFPKNFLPFYFISVAAKMAIVSTLNAISSSPKFRNNFHPPVSNVHRFYSSTKYVAVNYKASRYCFIFEWVNKLLCFNLRSAQSVVPWIFRNEKDFYSNKYLLGSWVHSINARNRNIQLVWLGEVPWWMCLQRARLIQAELTLCRVKNVIITPFRTFVVSPIEEL